MAQVKVTVAVSNDQHDTADLHFLFDAADWQGKTESEQYRIIRESMDIIIDDVETV